MIVKRFLRCIILTGTFCGLFILGCQQYTKDNAPKKAPAGAKSPEQAKIALKPTIGEMVRYKIVTQARRTTKWQGPVPQQAEFQENFNEERVEMTIKKRVDSVDANVAVAEVTIEELKCLTRSKKDTSVDFDSSKSSDVNNPLMKLIGKTYKVEYNPSNNISAVDELPPINVMFKEGTPSDQAGMNMMYPESLIERHGAFGLPPQGREMVKPNDKWSKIKTFAFGKMGIKSYEKVYTLKAIEDKNGRQIAVIDMNAIPSSEVEPRYASQKAQLDVPKMFDSKDSFSGSGDFDVKAGRIENYTENFHAEWFVALPSKQAESSEPVVLNMSSEYFYNIQRVK